MSELLKRIDRALWPHFNKQISTWSSHHTSNQHESDSLDCDPDLCFDTVTICNGCGTQGCTEPLADLMREVRPLVAEVRRLRDGITGLAEKTPWKTTDHQGTVTAYLISAEDLRALLAVNGDSHTHAHTGGDEGDA